MTEPNGEPTDLGRTTSRLLSEVRTVLSRAQTALKWYDRDAGEWRWDGEWIRQAELDIVPGQYEWKPVGDPMRVDTVWAPHPDRERILDALTKCVDLLSPWERTGRPLKTP